MPSTLLLDPGTWDLTVDISGNIAVAAEPYALAQDAASYIKLFQGELWYDTTRGIPYWQQILSKLPPIGAMKTYFVDAAELVPGVVTAQCFISSTAERTVRGQVQILDETGAVVAASSF